MMLLYVTLGSNDIARSRKFYDAAMVPLGIICTVSNEDGHCYGPIDSKTGERQNILWIEKPYMELPATWGNGTMIALNAQTRKQVDEFYAAGMANGGVDEGAPGLRRYSPNFYACYMRDPDGNKLSAVCEAVE